MSSAAGASPRRTALVVCVAVMGLVWTAAPAGAHAVLLDSDPADGEVVEGAPQAVVLLFSEPMRQPATVTVTGPAGEVVADGAADVDGERVVLPLETVTGDGVYTVGWRAVSADDHPVEGEFAFEVVDAPDPEPTPEPTPTPAPTPSPTPNPTPTPEQREAVPDDDATAAAATDAADDGGVLGWLLGAAGVLAVSAAGAAALMNRRRQDS